MDEHQLREEGFYNKYAAAGARTEMPGCSLCMGNQARVQAGASVVSTSTRNFPNRLGQGPTCIWPRPNWRRSRPSWAGCPRWTSTCSTRKDRFDVRRHLQVPELRQDAGVHRGRRPWPPGDDPVDSGLSGPRLGRGPGLERERAGDTPGPFLAGWPILNRWPSACASVPGPARGR
ncbi:MAG: aconitase family protein [Burkholderiaceae bacterium]